MEEKCWLYDHCKHTHCNDDFCMRKYKTEYLLHAACLEPAQLVDPQLRPDKEDFEAFCTLRSMKENIGKFVNEGYNLFLYSSNCGNGKTSWSIKLLRAYIQSIWAEADLSCHALFINVPRYLMALKDSISNTNTYADYVKENIDKADLIVWDDIAAKVGTEYELNQLLSRMELRFNAKKSNIFTSNTTLDRLGEAVGERLASRIAGNSVHIELTGSDKRMISSKKWEVK